MLLAADSHVPAAELQNFITRRGDQLMDGDKPFRFISFNIPNLLVIEDAFEFTKSSPWRWPDEFEINDALESVRQLGGEVVRTYVISVFRKGSDMGQTVHVFAPGKFNEEGFVALDQVLAAANRQGVRLIIPFYDRAPWMGGQPQYAEFRGKQTDDFWTDPQLIADFKKTIEHVVNRTNTITGVPYKEDKAILAWETGNEIDATPEWTHEIASYIKSLDPNHLVVDGRSLHGIEQWQIEEPATDIVGTHHYPWGPGSDFVTPIRKAHALAKGKKPYFVGEFGFVDTPHLARVMDAVVADGISGALLWSLRFHNRDGGFYWHMEVGTGGNFYKAYHWPGFASGAAYDETAVLELARDKAFEIRSQRPPALEPPAPPKLLPIADVAAISWQGSTGASSYDVERAESADGPWTQVGRDVTDADVQYRPLFSDANVVPGNAYFYRIVARNASGESPPSNVVGPVRPQHRTLVDECRNLDQLAGHRGDVSLRTDNVRRVQEDAHRIVLAPGAAIDYRVAGPIRAWRVYAFAESEEAELAAAGSADGERFTPLAVDCRVYSPGGGDYGYLAAIRYSGMPEDGDAQTLRLSLPVSAKEPLQIARVEIDFEE
ncbi:MAG: cellulase family glycosylhydrolase [Pirellulales bacterium]